MYAAQTLASLVYARPRGASVTRDDVVLQRPEDIRFLVPVFHTSNACCGAATAYLLRRIAYRAGAYAPGIQEHMFHELNTSREGGTIEKVQRWFAARVASLHELGYRLQCRRVATPTAAILEWVQGRASGYRGAMLPTSFKKLHPSPAPPARTSPTTPSRTRSASRSIASTPRRDEELVMIDPWPGVIGERQGSREGLAALELAHRDANFHALVFYWVGWS